MAVRAFVAEVEDEDEPEPVKYESQPDIEVGGCWTRWVCRGGGEGNERR